MEKKIVEAIVNGEVNADIGKFTKDGADYSWSIKTKKYSELTGLESGEVERSIMMANLENQIAELEKELKMYKDLKVILQGKDIPILADLTEVIEPLEDP